MQLNLDNCFCYVGKVPGCGCIVAAHLDTGRDCAEDVARMVADGLVVERVKGPVTVKACQCGPIEFGDPGIVL